MGFYCKKQIRRFMCSRDISDNNIKEIEKDEFKVLQQLLITRILYQKNRYCNCLNF